jgi:GT2 family glycosyltransferase
MSTKNPELSVVILSFNVKELLINCLQSLFDNKSSEDHWQVIVVDNNSADGSLEEAKKQFPEIEPYQTGANLGFARGNNYAVPYIKGEFVLFLNPDTLVVKDVIQKSLEFMRADEKVGALTCRVEFPDKRLDYSCHRGFPTPWNSFSYFSGLSKFFPKSPVFSGYAATYLDINTTHEIDCGSGTFLMVKTDVGKKIGFWDQDYFWNGEDIEFFYRVKELGYKNYYFAEGKIIHFKGSSSGLWSTAKVKVPKETKIRSARHASEAMKIFYKKHYYKKYPVVVRDLILGGISLLEKYRLFKINMGLKYK